MKKYNTRLLVTSGLLLALTTIAMSTGTYAWFTVNKTAAFNATASVKADNDVEIGLVANGGHCDVDYGTTAIELDVAHAVSSASDYTTEMAKSAAERKTSAHTLQDISGDGATFFKPIFAADNKTFNALSSNDATKKTSSGATFSYDNYYMVATFKFRSDNAYHIMIGDTSSMITDTKTKGLQNSARLAFFDSGKECTTTLTRDMLRQIVYEGSSDEYYISDNTAANTTTSASGTASTGYTKFSSMTITDSSYCDQTALSIPMEDSGTSKPSSIAAGHSAGYRSLTVLEKTNNKYTSADGSQVDEYVGSVTVVLWIEGADADCVVPDSKTAANPRDGSLSISVDFAALIA